MIVPTRVDALKAGDLVAVSGLRVRVTELGSPWADDLGRVAISHRGIVEASYEGGPHLGRQWTIQGRPDIEFGVIVGLTFH